MAKVVLLSRDKAKVEKIEAALKSNSFEFEHFFSESELFEYFRQGNADITLIDAVNMPDITNLSRKIRVRVQTKNTVIILIVDASKDNREFLKYGGAYLSEPLNTDIMLATVTSAMQTKNSWEELSVNNAELSKSLYRLNVLNNMVTQLAGSFDKRELIEIMTEGLEKSLSYSLCCSLIFNEPDDAVLLINSVYLISQRLEDAIKLRAMLSYKDLFPENKLPENINVIKKIKSKDREFDLNLFNFDTGLVPIKIKDKLFGIIEIFRETDFTSEDTRWFQTMVKQATFPLQSTVLYEEIKEQNLKLEESEKMKSEFFSIVSHELKTPLTAIRNSIKILTSKAFTGIPERATLFIKMIERNAERLLSIIQDLLDSAKAEAGKLNFNFTTAEINPVADSVRHALNNLAEENKIKFEAIKADNLPKLYIDTQRIEQGITNLVSNALKFTPEGGSITITTGLMSSEELRERPFDKNKDRMIADEYVYVKVSDTGPGIAEEDYPKIFAKFEQVKGTLSRNVGGTGLGLSIAKEFAETHHGFLWFESKVNKGSDFYLALPVLFDYEKFEMQLQHDMTSANSEKKSFGMVMLCENKTDKPEYLEKFVKILNEENVFKKTANSKEFRTETKERLYISFYDINMNEQILNFIDQRLTEFANKDTTIGSGKKIYKSITKYPDDAANAEDMIKKAKKLLKEVI